MVAPTTYDTTWSQATKMQQQQQQFVFQIWVGDMSKVTMVLNAFLVGTDLHSQTGYHTFRGDTNKSGHSESSVSSSRQYCIVCVCIQIVYKSAHTLTAAIISGGQFRVSYCAFLNSSWKADFVPAAYQQQKQSTHEALTWYPDTW